MDPSPKAIELRAEQEGMKLEVLSWTRDLPWILQIFRNVAKFFVPSFGKVSLSKRQSGMLF